MTTIAAAVKDGMIAIAADSLVRFGSHKEPPGYTRSSSKIIKFGSTWMGTTGPAVFDNILSDYMGSRKKLPPLENVDQIFRFWLKFHTALKEKYFINPDEDEDDSFESSQMSMLLANPKGIFGVSYDRRVIEYTRFWSIGSGSSYAMGAMYSLFEQEGKSAADIALGGVQAGAEFHSGSAPPFQVELIKLQH